MMFSKCEITPYSNIRNLPFKNWCDYIAYYKHGISWRIQLKSIQRIRNEGLPQDNEEFELIEQTGHSMATSNNNNYDVSATRLKSY